MKWKETNKYDMSPKRLVVKTKDGELAVHYHLGSALSQICMRDQYEFYLDESPSTPILGAEGILDSLPVSGWESSDIIIPRSKAIQAMQIHSAQYRDECARLREENKELKERYFSAEEINKIQEVHYDAGFKAASE